MEMRIIRDKTPDIVIFDPFYMRAKILGCAGRLRLVEAFKLVFGVVKALYGL